MCLPWLNLQLLVLFCILLITFHTNLVKTYSKKNESNQKQKKQKNIYKKNELESAFTEIMNPKKWNIIVGAIYKHPSMDRNYLNNLLEKVSKEQKSAFVLGDFNLLNYNFHNPSNEFLDSPASNSFLLYILQHSSY